MKVNNLFSNLPDSTMEAFKTLLQTKHLKLERIVSSGQATAPGEWLDQDADEWVILLKGRAGLLFEGEQKVCIMKPGDYIHIPMHKRHRVEWTDANQKTVWLALHY